MIKIVYNGCYGGFSLSEEAYALFRILGGIAADKRDFPEDQRHNPLLVRVVEALGKKAGGDCSSLKIVEVKRGTPYRIKNHDGYETVKTLDISEWAIAL